MANSNTPKLIERSVKGLHETLVPLIVARVHKESRILDLGCGTGAWLDRLGRAGFSRLIGLDFDVDQVKTDAAEFAQVDFDLTIEWPVAAESCDIVTAIEVIEHLTNIGHFLDQASRVMKPSGRLLLTTPNISSIAARMRFLFLDDMKQFGVQGDKTHLFPVVPGTFKRVLERSGLELVEMWGYPAGGRTLTSRGWVNLLAAVGRTFLPESIPGDNLCMLIKRRGSE